MNFKLPITREEAKKLLASMPQAEADWNHYLETESIMRDLAEKFGEDKEYWGMLGLLHDVDWSLTKNKWEEHCLKAEEILKEKGFDDEFIENIKSHGYGCSEIPMLKDKKRTKKIEFALASAETLTGIIYAYALMKGKNITSIEVSGFKKKFKDKRFAANCNREIASEIEKTGLSLDEFFELAINAIRKIKDELGLK